jgi:hypothetical protein
MIGIRLNTAKAKFFDPKKIKDPAERAGLSMLAKFGAYVRRRAKSSIRKRKKVSEPGMPPSSHLGQLKDFLFFFVEKEQKNVVVGPILLGKGDGTAPRLLEHGGDVMRRRAKQKHDQRYHYSERPFMQPAFDAEIEKAPALLKDKVR